MDNVSAREMVMSAYQYLLEILPPTQKVYDIRTEEIKPAEEPDESLEPEFPPDDYLGEDEKPKEEEISPNNEVNPKFWYVILSYNVHTEFPLDKEREYKKFKISEDNKVLFMESKKC